MFEEIRSFFDELRVQRSAPSPTVMSPDPRDVAFQHIVQGALLATKKVLDDVDNKLENWLVGIYEAGADDPDQLEFLNRVMAIIRKRHLDARVRLQEIAGLLNDH